LTAQAVAGVGYLSEGIAPPLDGDLGNFIGGGAS